MIFQIKIIVNRINYYKKLFIDKKMNFIEYNLNN